MDGALAASILGTSTHWGAGHHIDLLILACLICLLLVVLEFTVPIDCLLIPVLHLLRTCLHYIISWQGGRLHALMPLLQLLWQNSLVSIALNRVWSTALSLLVLSKLATIRPLEHHRYRLLLLLAWVLARSIEFIVLLLGARAEFTWIALMENTVLCEHQLVQPHLVLDVVLGRVLLLSELKLEGVVLCGLGLFPCAHWVEAAHFELAFLWWVTSATSLLLVSFLMD